MIGTTNPSASSWDRIMRCAPSGVTELVQIKRSHARADHGTKVHKYASLCLLMGPEEAGKAMLAAGTDPELVAKLVTVDVKARLEERLGKAVQFRSEHPMAIDMATLQSRHLPAGQERDYSDCSNVEIPGTWDLFWEGEEYLDCIDFKTSQLFGARELLSEHSWQLNIGLLCWNQARMTPDTKKRRKVIVHWDDDMNWTLASEEVTPEYLTAAMDALWRKLAEIREDDPQQHQAGSHCKFCPKYDRCPATTDLLRSMVVASGNADADALVRGKSAADAVRIVKRIKALAAELDERMKDYARHSPIDMGNGKVYREVPCQRSAVDTSSEKAMSLIHEFGADEAVVYESKATAASLQKILGKKKFEALMAKLREADGIKVTRWTQLKEVEVEEDPF